MQEIIKNLTLIASDLDKSGSTKFADKIDKIANNVLDIKTAQYAGFQGYWVRSQRCWGNCYRNKRLSNPNMPSQEVWADCHKEYIDAINSSDTKKWDKYAGSNNFVIKSADVRKQIDKDLKNRIEEKMSNGADVRTAIISAIREIRNDHSNKLIEASKELLDIADRVKSFDLAMKLAKSASYISKEAQWWNPKDWAAKGVGKAQDAARGITDWAADRRQQNIDRTQQKADRLRQQEQNRGYTGVTPTPKHPVPTAPSSTPATQGVPATGDVPLAPSNEAINVGRSGENVPTSRFQSGTNSVIQQPGQTVTAPGKPGPSKSGPSPAGDSTATDTDQDGTPDVQDVDNNNNGIVDAEERVFNQSMERKKKRFETYLKNKEKLEQQKMRLNSEYGGKAPVDKELSKIRNTFKQTE